MRTNRRGTRPALAGLLQELGGGIGAADREATDLHPGCDESTHGGPRVGMRRQPAEGLDHMVDLFLGDALACLRTQCLSSRRVEP